MNENCWMGDHDWNGTSQCINCGARLRCICGCLIREDHLEAHLIRRCPVAAKAQFEDTPA